MNLEPYVESIRTQLERAAEGAGDEARTLVARLAAQLDAGIRLALQDALAAAAEEVTLELAPGSVELRLRGREPEFVVTLPPSDRPDQDAGAGYSVTGGTVGEDAVARINLRLPDRLKSQVEAAAANEGLSVNSWLVRSAAASLGRIDAVRGGERRTAHGAQRYTGWAR
jgi:hypothetical protein